MSVRQRKAGEQVSRGAGEQIPMLESTGLEIDVLCLTTRAMHTNEAQSLNKFRGLRPDAGGGFVLLTCPPAHLLTCFFGHWVILGAISIFSSLGVFVPLASAETKRADLTLSLDRSQTFPDLIEQAEASARSLVEQGFAENANITDVSVTILVERNGQQVPLLFSNVSRSDWQSKPRIQEWAKYPGRSAMVLLGFAKPDVQRTASALPKAPILPATRASNSPIPAGLSGASLEESDPGYR